MDGIIFMGKLTPQDTMYRFQFGSCRRARLDKMVKKWGREIFIFYEIISALYLFC